MSTKVRSTSVTRPMKPLANTDDSRRRTVTTKGALNKQPDTPYVFAASSTNIDDAIADYEAVKQLYYEVAT
jgi:hypothetical protein